MLGRMRGSIALLPASELDSQAALKVLAIDGKRPDDDGYPLLSKPKTLTGANPQSSGTSAESPTAEASFHRQLAAQPDEPGAIERPATMEDWDGDGWPPIHMLVFAHGRAEGESSKAAGSTRDTNSFGIEVVDVLLTSALTDRMSILAETTYAAQDSGEFVVEVERLLLKYCFNDALNVKAGRFLTSIGYWNRHYHHGEWLQTSIDRPEVIDFEDESGLLPIHSVGVGLNGSFFTGAGVLEYTLEVANGRGPTADVTQSKQDGNREKAINVAVGMKPEFLPGVEFGAGSYFDRIPENTDASAGALHGQVQEQITNLYCAYNDTNWELMGEYFFLEHDYGDRTTHSKGWYAQVGRHLGDWTPYVRVDGIDRAALDDYFESTDAGLTTAIGIRRDINSHAALTLQYERAQVDAQPGGQDIVNQSYVLQLSVVF